MASKVVGYVRDWLAPPEEIRVSIEEAPSALKDGITAYFREVIAIANLMIANAAAKEGANFISKVAYASGITPDGARIRLNQLTLIVVDAEAAMKQAEENLVGLKRALKAIAVLSNQPKKPDDGDPTKVTAMLNNCVIIRQFVEKLIERMAPLHAQLAERTRTSISDFASCYASIPNEMQTFGEILAQQREARKNAPLLFRFEKPTQPWMEFLTEIPPNVKEALKSFEIESEDLVPKSE